MSVPIFRSLLSRLIKSFLISDLTIEFPTLLSVKATLKGERNALSSQLYFFSELQVLPFLSTK